MQVRVSLKAPTRFVYKYTIMRISEITEASDLTVRSGIGIDASRKQQLAKPGAVELGHGAFGSAFIEPGDVEKVKKISKLGDNKWNRDGYFAYVDAIRRLSKQAKMNPYLPQIYNVKAFETKNNKRYLEVTMEKLYSYNNLNTEEVISVLEKITQTQLEREKFKKKDLIDIIKYCIDHPDVKKLYPKENVTIEIADSNFKKAVKLIHGLTRYFEKDIHDQNIMFRRTSAGVQLVLTDPLSFRA